MTSRVFRSGLAKIKTLRGLAIVCLGIMLSGLVPLNAHANSKYAGIVLDAKTGKVLYARNADAARYPASLTKIMTLYILFEELEAGRLTLGSQLKISKYAASRPPSKIGLKPGSTIAVRDAIGALVTKSANDIATAISENISGSQEAFARRMTATARRIGMNRTTFRNASGLPDSRQKTTARDMAQLGLAIQDHFPKYYKYFSMRKFKFKGRKYGNHNRLLGQVKGVDGIKTGYTRASGFNLVSSVSNRDRHIIAVVMGGRTGRSRDAQMKKLINAYLAKARTGKRSAPMVAGRAGAKRVVIANAPLPVAKPDSPIVVAAIAIPPVPPRSSPIALAEPGAITSTGSVPTPTARINAAYDMAIGATGSGPLRLDTAIPMPGEASIPEDASYTARTKAILLAIAPPAEIPDAATQAAGKFANHQRVAKTPIALPPVRVEQDTTIVTASPKPVQVAAIDTTANTTDNPPPSGWQVQIAATPSQESALDLLKKAKVKAGKALVGRTLYTESVKAGNDTLYRARFTGFTSKASAKAACRSLKKAKFACYHLHQ